MYYEEVLINGIVYYRGDPRGEFRAYTLEELSERYMRLLKEYNHVLNAKEQL